MGDDHDTLIVGASMLVVGLFISFFISAMTDERDRRSCAEQHNVYTCEFHGEWVPAREAAQ